MDLCVVARLLDHDRRKRIVRTRGLREEGLAPRVRLDAMMDDLYAVAISGSRELRDQGLVERVIDRLIERQVKVLVACGIGDDGNARCTRGVDAWAHQYVEHRADDVVDYDVFYAEWPRYRKAAGMYRNETMIHAADELVAFLTPGSTGTLDCIRRAVEKRIPHHIYYEESGLWCSFDR